MSAGVANADADSAKTMIEPDSTPGMICGNTTRRNTLSGDPPSERPAHSTCGSSFCMLAQTDITMNGTSTCVSAMIMPVIVKTRRMGSLVTCSACSTLLSTPLLPSRICQPSVRTTTEMSSGPSTIKRHSDCHGFLMRARMIVSGTPSTMESSVTPNARPAVRRKIVP